MKSKSLLCASVLAATALFSMLTPKDGLAQAPTKELLACYGVCNRTVPNQQKRNDCFRACKAGQTPTSTTSPVPSKSGWQYAKPAPATTPPVTARDLTACYGVCNRTVPNQQKRNACFQACRTTQSSTGATAGSSSMGTPSGGRSELDTELEVARQQRGACMQTCYQRYTKIDDQRRCEDVCYGQHHARSNAAYDRNRARSNMAKAATTVPVGNCRKGCEALHARYAWEANQRGGAKFPPKSTWVPACVARCSPAMPACQEALAILRGAKNIKPGAAGFLGQSRIELWEAKLKSCGAPDQDTLRFANEIRKAWNESLAAPRYIGE